ncbi:MAG: helix-turn-helix domain-containing protein [Clostridia bacterium]|nr:helix-turn-helix domain-containing protein [Clostridia bacterium]
MNEQNLTQPERRIRELLSVVLRHYTREELAAPTTPLHRKEDFLVYVLSGECTYDIDGKEVSLQKGGVIFLSKNSVYRRTSASEDFLTIFVYFHFERDEDEPAFYQRFPAVDALEGTFLKLYRKWSARGIAYQSECTGLLYQLYAQLVQSTVSGYLPQKRRQIFEELVHSIAENLSSTEVNVAALAAQAGMSEVHFRRCFRKLYNASPQEFIVARRITLAEELLLYGQESVGEIAELAGFADQGYFSRLFKQKTGYTPSEYRKLFQP